MFLLLLFVSSAWATTYYLDASICESGDGTSWVKAKKTWPEMDILIDTLGDDGADDTVLCKDGIYGALNSGIEDKTRTSWLIIQAEDNHTPTFSLLDISGASANKYLKLIGLTFDGRTNATNVVIDVHPGNYVFLDSCLVYGREGYSGEVQVPGIYSPYYYTNASTVFFRTGNNLTVQDCEVIGGYNSIYFYNDCDVILVHGNTVHRRGDGIQLNAYTNIICEDNVIYDCDTKYCAVRLYESDGGAATFTQYKWAKQATTNATGVVESNPANNLYVWENTATVFNNSDVITQYEDVECTIPSDGPITWTPTVYDPLHTDDITMDIQSGEAAISNIVIQRNKCYGADYHAGIKIWISDGTTSTGIKIINNLLYPPTDSLAVIALTGVTVDEIINNTIFDGVGSTAALRLYTDSLSGSTLVTDLYNNSIESLILTETGEKTTVVTNSDNNHFGGITDTADGHTPGEDDVVDQDFSSDYFTDFAGDDYTLVVGSPAIDAGDADKAPVDDVDGNTRDASPDIGAYEYDGNGDVGWLRVLRDNKKGGKL